MQVDVDDLAPAQPRPDRRVALDGMAPGDQLEVTSTDPGSLPDFQGWVKTAKHALLKEQHTAKDETGREVYVHLLERK